MAWQTSPEAFVVRVLGPSGSPVGAGVLVSERRIVTCAHVVNAALGRSSRAQDRPILDAEVRVDFPRLLDAGSVLSARIIAWVPPPSESSAGDDVAGLELTDPAPAGTAAARLSVETPRVGQQLRVIGFPPLRPNGAWAAVTVQARVGDGQLKLESLADAATRIGAGFSGGAVVDDEIGRVIGLMSDLPRDGAAAQEGNAITAGQLRLAWPEQLGRGARRGAGTRGEPRGELTILHVSDPQFGKNHIFGGNGLTPADQAEDTLFARLHHDLDHLAESEGLRPDLMVVTGDLAEWGLRGEFAQITRFLAALAEATEIPRKHVAIVPGNHDINRTLCQAYFLEQQGNDEEPVAPYWPKWRHFAAAFVDFYAEVAGATFTPDEPWTLFEMPDLNVVVAGLNSTMAESHRDEDHYGWMGEHQLQWFAGRLAPFKAQGWLRIAAVHHNAVRGAVQDDENLRDVADLNRVLGQPHLVNLLLHGHTHDANLHFLPSGLAVLSTGSAAVNEGARPAEVPNQYQLVTVRRDSFTRHARQYSVGQKRWIGDTRVSDSGSSWRDERSYPLTDVNTAFPAPSEVAEAAGVRRSPEAGDLRSARTARAGRDAYYAEGNIIFQGGGTATARPDSLLARVAEATRVRFPGATVVECPGAEIAYLRVSRPLEAGGVETFAVGVIDGPATDAGLAAFESVHAQFRAYDPLVRSTVVHASPPASVELAARAGKQGIQPKTFVSYQGLLDLSALEQAQRAKLAEDRAYPPGLYVEQRFRLSDSGGTGWGVVRDGLISQAVRWLNEDTARLMVVLGDFGRGKTSFLRQLTRLLPQELPSVLPVLVELRTLEKAPTLYELLAQHLVRNDVPEVNLPMLKYMIESGRLALLFDGFDELELRVGYDNATDYLKTLVNSLTGQAKLILTSRTQHFRSTDQVRTALGATIETRSASRVVLLEEFSEQQIRQFLVNFYGGDEALAQARFDLISDIENLLDLAHNPRILAFVAALDKDRLLKVQQRTGTITQAALYGEIIDFWLTGEAKRQEHHSGLISLDAAERRRACTALALRLWESTSTAISMADLSAEVAATLTNLAERGYTKDQASHAIASGSLLVRTEDDAFSFIHQSVMEWLVADAAVGDPNADILGRHRMSRLMTSFYADISGSETAQDWASQFLSDQTAPTIAKQNALDVVLHLRRTGVTANVRPVDQNQTGRQGQHLAGIDLRDLDLARADLSGADLRGADLRGMRLHDVNLSGADLTDADLTGVRMTRGSLRATTLTDSTWTRAAILDTEDIGALAGMPELAAAAIVGRDRTELMVPPPFTPCSVAFSPDGTLLAVCTGRVTEIVDMASGHVARVLYGHTDSVTAVTFSPDGTLIATASDDETACIWDAATGTLCSILTGHTDSVTGVAFSPDGVLIATASWDCTARTWEPSTGQPIAILSGHQDAVNAIAFSPVASLIATASNDRTARTWDSRTGQRYASFTSHADSVTGVAFSPDGTRIATASNDRTARTWDPATGQHYATLTGHHDRVTAVAFSPEGNLIATASADDTARTWDPRTGRHLSTLTGHRDQVVAVAFSPDGERIVTASDDYTIRAWAARTGRHIATLIGESPSSLDAPTKRLQAILTEHEGSVSAVAFSPDGTRIATASTDRTARTWDSATGRQLTTLTRHYDPVTAVAWSPDGTRIATASADYTARTWDSATGRQLTTLTGHNGRVTAVAWSPDGTRIATASRDGTARTWDPATGRRRTLTGHDHVVNALAYSADGTRIATASYDGTARTWDPATRQQIAVLTGHEGWVISVAWSPDGTLMATASDDGTTRLWNATTGALLATLVTLRDGGYANLFPDGSYKLEGDPTDRIWWAIKLCRFEPGELDPYVPEIRRLPLDAPILTIAP